MRYTLDEYFAIEQASVERHEYFAGEVSVVPGASFVHATITTNVGAAFWNAVRSSPYVAFSCGMRIRTPAGLYAYPDASIVEVPVDVVRAGETDTVGNPIVLVEVRHDQRRPKFDLYRSIPTLRDYLLIEQTHPQIEHRFLTDGQWRSTTLTEGAVRLTGVDLELPFDLVYEGITF